MKKTHKIILIVTSLIILVIINYFIINYYRHKYAKVIIEYNTLEVDFLSKVKVSDFIKSINGKIIDNHPIDTTIVGKQVINYHYINEDKLKLKQSFEIQVIDKIPPLVMLRSSYTYKLGSQVDLLKTIFCGDNYDATIQKEIIGSYDFNKLGSYHLIFKATDQSGNVTQKKFQVNIVNNLPRSTPPQIKKTSFQDIVKKYKSEKTEIGLDISKWQGEVDFKKLKESGVEFVFIRLGGKAGINEERYLDSRFIQNITRANEVGIPVGLYFHSNANSVEDAIADANFVLKNIQGKKVTLPIAFDWESWSSYSDFNLSFYQLSKSAQAFIETIEKSGYQGILYSSKIYLEEIWYDFGYPIWLAHYTDKTNYQKDYDFWQLCNTGRVNGIVGPVDIDIRYK